MNYKIWAFGLIPGSNPQPVDTIQFIKALEILSLHNIKTIKHVNHKLSSYRLKHLIERNAGQYISNGACMAACAMYGMRICRISQTPNCEFNIGSVASIINHQK